MNGQTVELYVPGKIVDGRTLIPLRFVGESLGASVNWDPTLNQINICSTQPGTQIITQPKTPAAIGINLELTGYKELAKISTNVNNGLKLAFQENEDLYLTLLEEDCKSSAAGALAASQKLLKSNIIAQIGPLTSGDVLSCLPLLEDSGIPLLTPAASSLDITVKPDTGKTYNYIYRAYLTDPQQRSLMPDFSSNGLNVKTCAIIYNCDSDYSASLALYKTSFINKGGQVVLEEAYYNGDTDFTQILEIVKNQKCDFIYMPGLYQEVGPLIKQARVKGINQSIGGGDGWDSPEIIKLAGAKAMNNTYFVNHFSVDDSDQTVVDFVKKYKAVYGKLPDGFAALGYDSAKMLCKAIRNAQSYDPKAIADSLDKIKDFSGVTGNITMGLDHNPIKSGIIIEFREGKQVFKQRI